MAKNENKTMLGVIIVISEIGETESVLDISWHLRTSLSSNTQHKTSKLSFVVHLGDVSDGVKREGNAVVF